MKQGNTADNASHSVVALIPAKLTSRRIPEKNCAVIAGTELLVYSIRAALRTRGIGAVYVSSESEKILDLAVKAGANTILRPAELSQDNVTNQRVIKHAVDSIESQYGNRLELLVLLQPTHPFRSPLDIEVAIDTMVACNQFDSLFALRPLDVLSGRLEDGCFQPDVPLTCRRTDWPKRYVNTGSFYVLRLEKTIRSGSFFGTTIGGNVLSRPDLEIDIDHPEQLAAARGMADFFHDDLVKLGLID